MNPKASGFFFKIVPGYVRFSRKKDDSGGQFKTQFRWRPPAVAAGTQDCRGNVLREWRWGPPDDPAEQKTISDGGNETD